MRQVGTAVSVVGSILFTGNGGAGLEQVLSHQSQQGLSEALDDIPEKHFAAMSDDEAVALVVSKIRVEPLELLLDQAVNSADEISVDVSNRRDMISFPPGRQAKMKGFSVVKAIPFKGDQQLWFSRPSTYDSNPPYGDVSHGSIRIGLEVIERELEQAKSHIIGELAKINNYIAAQRQTIDQHNAVIAGLANMRVKERRGRLNKAADFLKDF